MLQIHLAAQAPATHYTNPHLTHPSPLPGIIRLAPVQVLDPTGSYMFHFDGLCDSGTVLEGVCFDAVDNM